MSSGWEFDGDTYDAERDGARLHSQLERVRDLMRGGDWWTLVDLAQEAGGSEASVSARLRDLRKPRFGGYAVERKYIENGLWAYRLLPPERSTATGAARDPAKRAPTAEEFGAALDEIEQLIQFRRTWVASYTPGTSLSVVKEWLARERTHKVRA